MTAVREATPDELAGWDAAVVDRPGGHVLQSRAWAAHRRATGWHPLHLVTEDGGFVLALTKSWPGLPGGSAYLPRGPAPIAESEAALATRLADVADHLARRGIDVIASDAEVAVGGEYGEAIRRSGFRPIEEIQPSRHRMAIPLGPAATEDEVLAGIAKQTRARIRSAEGAGVHVEQFGGRPGERPATRAALGEFYELETATAERKGFALGPAGLFLDWWEAAMGAGHLVYLEARAPGGAGPGGPMLGGLVLYRHGGRLSTVQSADHVELRSRFPGVLHLLRWRAIQLALAEGCSEMDLGGADVAGARRIPTADEPLHGLYEHKASFGARWVEQVGAHEQVRHRLRYAAGRTAAAIARRIGTGR